MTSLEANKPLMTDTPSLQIDGLKDGVYYFQLRVFDDVGNVSFPDIISIEVRREPRVARSTVMQRWLSRMRRRLIRDLRF